VNGNLLAVDDEVIVRCRVANVHPGENYCNGVSRPA
jgi:hypothetical protein